MRTRVGAITPIGRWLDVSKVTLALAILLFGVSPPAAEAAFPGSNGRVVFETGRTDEFDIYSMEPDGSDLQQLTSGVREDHAPRWSPDGTRIAYYRSLFDGPGNIWIMDADGSNKHRLTSGKPDDRDPAWSPDGAELVFTRATKTNVDLFVIEADGAGLHRLTTNTAADFAPAWSSTDLIAFTSERTGGGDLYVLDAGGSGPPERLTHGARADLYANWSPDGSQLALFRQLGPVTSDRELYVMDADGTGLTRLTNNNADDSYPGWSPDGTRISFQSDRHNGFYDVYTMNTDGSGVTPLMQDGFIDGRPDWQAT